MSGRAPVLTDELLAAMLNRRMQRADAGDLAVEIVAAVAGERQRGRWPLPVFAWPLPVFAIPSWRVLVVALAAVLAALAALAGAASLLRHQSPLHANGLIAYAQDGAIEVVATDGTPPRTLIHDPVLKFAGPVWSRDGSRLAFTTQDDGIYAADSAGGSFRRVATGRNPVWLDNGDLVYASADGTLWRLPMAGATPERIATVDPGAGTGFGTLVSSADGSKVAFLMGGAPELKGLLDRITIVDVEHGGAEQTLTADQFGLRAIYRFALSPDGTRLAVNGTSCPASGPLHVPEECPTIVIAGIDGSIQGSIGSATEFALRPAWSPDGSRLAYIRNVIDGSGGLASQTTEVMSADGQEVASIPSGSRDVQMLKWSPDGTSLLHIDADDGTHVVVSNLRGENILDLPASADNADWQPLPPVQRPGLAQPTGRIGFLSPPLCAFVMLTGGRVSAGQFPACPQGLGGNAWSTDGRLLIAAADRITVLDAGGNILHQFADPGHDGDLPDNAWSAGGGWVVLSWDSSGTTDCFPRTFFVARPDGTGIREIPGWPVWTADDTRMAVLESDDCGPPGRMLVGAGDGSGLVPLPIDTTSVDAPLVRWSPDGSRLAFTQRGDAWVLTLGNATPVNVTRFAHGGAGRIAWSPDGTQLAVTGDDGVSVVSADGSGAPRVVVTPSPGHGSPDISTDAWSRDGQHIAAGFEGGAVFETAVARADGGGVVWYDRGGWPTWSPDGRWVAFARRNAPELVVAAGDGSAVQVHAIAEQGDPFWPVWMP